MYKQHRNCVTPNQNTVIWRYLTLDKFESLMRGRMYFRNIFALKDDREGIVHPETVNSHVTDILLGREVLPFPGPLQMLTNISVHYTQSYQQVYATFWHQSENENSAMWEGYLQGGQGVAIKSTVGRLIGSLETVPEDLYIGSVRYVDMDAPQPWQNHQYLNKHGADFNWEKEVRAIIVARRPTENVEEEINGISRDCDLKTLIDIVVLCPNASAETKEAVYMMLAEKGFGDKCREHL